MSKGNYLTDIIRSPKTVLTINDISLIWGDSNSKAIKSRLSYYVKNEDLIRIRRGIYAKNQQYNKLELATRIFTPSYISFETVLAKEGVVFQYQTKIQLASYLTRKLEVDGEIYSYKKLKNLIVTNSVGVENINETSIASKERAFLDILYTNKNYHFDNLRSLDWDKVMTILPIYNNKRMANVVAKLFKQSKI
ncbi:MAG: hypothetical protein WCV93_05310 [Candidatus Shapirobacteria bacterium]|jgi:hypothetical protein